MSAWTYIYKYLYVLANILYSCIHTYTCTYTGMCIHIHLHVYNQREIMLFIGKPKGRSRMIYTCIDCSLGVSLCLCVQNYMHIHILEYRSRTCWWSASARRPSRHRRRRKHGSEMSGRLWRFGYVYIYIYMYVYIYGGVFVYIFTCVLM